MNPMETSNSADLKLSSEKQGLSPKVSSEGERETLKALLAEARQTKEVLEGFESAIKSGTFDGKSMLALAKGLSFLAAVLGQHKAHIFNLQARLEKPLTDAEGAD